MLWQKNRNSNKMTLFTVIASVALRWNLSIHAQRAQGDRKYLKKAGRVPAIFFDRCDFLPGKVIKPALQEHGFAEEGTNFLACFKRNRFPFLRVPGENAKRL
ncbi:hypothetical protein BaRGS_00000662 [Batillaria attramentaria]|uniref:Uncharacterized protein n=1 Tax=Batillaria attramentaria TaxID=370345 RepID=A0ABD0MAA6_9CAEN